MDLKKFEKSPEQLKNFEGSVLDCIKRGLASDLVSKEDLESFKDFYANEAHYNELKAEALKLGKKGKFSEIYIKDKMPNYREFSRARKNRGYIIRRIEETFGTSLINEGDFNSYTIIAYPVNYYPTFDSNGVHKIQKKTNFDERRGIILSNKEGFIVNGGEFKTMLANKAKEILKANADRILTIGFGDKVQLYYRITTDLSENLDRKIKRTIKK